MIVSDEGMVDVFQRILALVLLDLLLLFEYSNGSNIECEYDT